WNFLQAAALFAGLFNRRSCQWVVTFFVAAWRPYPNSDSDLGLWRAPLNVRHLLPVEVCAEWADASCVRPSRRWRRFRSMKSRPEAAGSTSRNGTAFAALSFVMGETLFCSPRLAAH